MRGIFSAALLPAVASALSYQNASTGLPPTHTWDCNPVFFEACNNPLDTGGWSDVAMGDVNGDGLADVGAVGRLLFGFHVWLSDGAGSWMEESSGLDASCHGRSGVAFSDSNRDGDLDLGGITGGNGLPGVSAGDGAGGWSDCSTGLLTGGGEGFAFGDFDGDGNPDLGTVGHFSGGAHAFLGDGACGWTESSAGLPMDGGGHRTTAADFDGDGRDELVITLFGGPTPSSNGVHVWRYDTQTANWSALASLYFDQAWGVAAADLDQDGWIDLVVGGFQDDVGTFGSVRVYLGGGATFTESSAGLPSGGDTFYTDVAVGDMDNDSDLDVLAGNYGKGVGAVRLFLNDGAASFVEASGIGLPDGLDSVEGLALGDADGDCRLDVGYAAYTCGVQVYRQADAPACPILAEAGPPARVCAGAPVTLEASASRACGCTGSTRYRWWAGAALDQDWNAGATLVRSPLVTTLYRVDVACSTDLTCFVSDTVLVTVADPATGACCADGTCQAGENACLCPGDCQAICGDGCCTAGEDCFSCSLDCVCPPDVGPDVPNDTGADATATADATALDLGAEAAADAPAPDVVSSETAVPGDVPADAPAPDVPAVRPDAGTAAGGDAGPDAADSSTTAAAGGCGCDLGGPAPSPGALWLLALLYVYCRAAGGGAPKKACRPDG